MAIQVNDNGEMREGEFQKDNSCENLTVPYENFESIVERITGLGIDDKDATRKFLESMQQGLAEFEIKRLINYGTDRVNYDLRYLKNMDGSYSLDKIKATIYPAIDVPALVINGIDIKKLESTMKDMDWNFEKFRWGREVEDSLRLISRDEDGKNIAVALWNNTVPSMQYDKPDFIQQSERLSGHYLTKSFPGDTNLKVIYDNLKERYLIGKSFSALPIEGIQYAQPKSKVVESLAKGEPFSCKVTTNSDDMREMIFTWDATSMSIKCSDKDGIEYHPEKDGRLARVNVQQNLKAKEVEPIQDELLLSKYRNGSNRGLKM